MRDLVVAVAPVTLLACARGAMLDISGDGQPPTIDAAPRQLDAPAHPLPDGAVDSSSASAHLVINEIDYDQVGTDDAEFVEIFNPSTNAIALAGLELVLVNGFNDTAYRKIDLSSL